MIDDRIATFAFDASHQKTGSLSAADIELNLTPQRSKGGTFCYTFYKAIATNDQ